MRPQSPPAESLNRRPYNVDFRSHRFVGRDVLLDKLQLNLESSLGHSRAVLYGLGGIG